MAGRQIEFCDSHEVGRFMKKVVGEVVRISRGGIVIVECETTVKVALGTKCRPGIRQNRRRLFRSKSRKPVSQRGVTPNTRR